MSILPIGAGAVISEGVHGLKRAIHQVFVRLERRCLDAIPERPIGAAEDLRHAEAVLGDLGRSLADHIAGLLVLASHETSSVRREAAQVARQESPYPVRSKGRKEVPVRFAGGTVFRFRTPYLVRKRRGMPGRPRKAGGRGKSGTGVYPVLAALGILWGVTPMLALDVAREATLVPFAEATDNLRERGIELDESTVCSITYHVADRILADRDALLAAMDGGTLEHGKILAGKRVAISVDGGRLRTREGGKRGRRRKKTNRRGFKATWREPIMTTIYLLDTKGKKVGKPFYNATMANWKDAYRMLSAVCIRLGLKHASEVVFLADGAIHIWDDVPGFVDRVGYEGPFIQVLDYYHAVEYLHDNAPLPRSWSEEKCRRWFRSAEQDLRAGDIESLIERVEQLSVGRGKGKARKTVLAYLERNRSRLAYADFKRRHIPRGSGPVESAIRRVINLRLKGCGIFWNPQNAERMLQLRCHLKAGRWSELATIVYGSPDETGQDLTNQKLAA